MTEKSTHGGPGRGGGRKPTGVKRVAVTLDDETIERARTLGNGNLSAGIRAAISAQREAEQMRDTFAAIKAHYEQIASPLAQSIPLTRSRHLVSNNTAEPVEFPEPVREPLKDGTPYCIASITEPGYCGKTEWNGRHFDNVWLQRGLVHLDEKSARQHAQALVKLSGGQV